MWGCPWTVQRVHPLECLSLFLPVSLSPSFVAPFVTACVGPPAHARAHMRIRQACRDAAQLVSVCLPPMCVSLCFPLFLPIALGGSASLPLLVSLCLFFVPSPSVSDLDCASAAHLAVMRCACAMRSASERCASAARPAYAPRSAVMRGSSDPHVTGIDTSPGDAPRYEVRSREHINSSLVTSLASTPPCVGTSTPHPIVMGSASLTRGSGIVCLQGARTETHMRTHTHSRAQQVYVKTAQRFSR